MTTRTITANSGSTTNIADISLTTPVDTSRLSTLGCSERSMYSESVSGK